MALIALFAEEMPLECGKRHVDQIAVGGGFHGGPQRRIGQLAQVAEEPRRGRNPPLPAMSGMTIISPAPLRMARKGGW